MKTENLRNLMNSGKMVKVMGAHNGLSAKLAENAGFDAIWASGFEIAATHVVPDANILTMTENLNVAHSINKSVSVPVICDCDSGYGDINNIAHMIKEYESMGISGVCIEDKPFPKLNSFLGEGQKLEDIEVFSEKIRVAQETKKNKNMVVIARIEAFIAGQGLSEVLKRAYAYKEAGADALLIHSKKEDVSEIYEFCNSFNENLPIVVVPTTYPNINLEILKAHGVRLVIYANHGIRSSVNAMKETFENIIKNGNTTNVEGTISSMEEIFRLQGTGKLRKPSYNLQK
ncbi:phosphoenolpyruvate mutase [Salipaludibacillus sp. LMS25]|jgi:phosphoenolpyruvate phosphomutase|uniref:phosphoenolpyruvate mutase n=1 Tax=Salipaludibacillus sp. LMS25 TaxID=2924031 RepID=UPI0020D072AF|nr:phosphoenolpyruvate mutase [Salipaludibacillus sp. LMS25]UTR15953.1 phosphoenolpyruvate mutase [Salipaludibacillus sp. LMS25]